MKLWLKILVGLLIGILLGLILRSDFLSIEIKAEVLSIFQTTGNLFLRTLQMLLPLLIFFAMVTGIMSISDLKKVGRLGLTMFGLFIITTMSAIAIGFACGILLQPGDSVVLSHQDLTLLPAAQFNLWQLICNIIPNNPIEAFMQGNTIQILFLALLLGLAINLVGTRAQPVVVLFQSFAHIMYQLISMIMQLAPYAICFIIAGVVGSFGWSILHALLQFVIAIYIASFTHMFLVYSAILLWIGLRPWPFFRGMREAILFAFSSSSSTATLPTTLICAQKNLGISAQMANFVLPLGAAINMNGTALFHALSAVFVSQMYHLPLTLTNYITIAFVATVSSIGTAGAPGSGIAILGTVLAAIGLPLEAIGILIGIDRLRDMIGTVVNILGDAIVAVYLAKKEHQLDENTYNNGDVALQSNS